MPTDGIEPIRCLRESLIPYSPGHISYPAFVEFRSSSRRPRSLSLHDGDQRVTSLVLCPERVLSREGTPRRGSLTTARRISTKLSENEAKRAEDEANAYDEYRL